MLAHPLVRGSRALKAFWQLCAEFPLKCFVFFLNIFVMFTCCFKEECGHTMIQLERGGHGQIAPPPDPPVAPQAREC